MVGKSHASAHLPPEEITGTHFTVDWMGPRGGLTGYGKISLPPPLLDSIPGPYSP